MSLCHSRFSLGLPLLCLGQTKHTAELLSGAQNKEHSSLFHSQCLPEKLIKGQDFLWSGNNMARIVIS